ncbi:hypothetical protein QUB00_26655 [Microcoleus sp. F8_C2]
MKPNNQQRATANKIKKWIQATQEVEKARFAIPITRLTSIKSLCADEVAAEKFALYIARLVQQQINQAICPAILRTVLEQRRSASRAKNSLRF